MRSRTTYAPSGWDGAEARSYSSRNLRPIIRHSRRLRAGRFDGFERDGLLDRTERSEHLGGHDAEVVRSRSLLLDPQRTLRQPRVGPDGLGRGKDRAVRELVPDRQREGEVDVLGTGHPVM